MMNHALNRGLINGFPEMLISENINYIDKTFAKMLFSFPSYSGFEIRMLEFLADWASRNWVSWNQDENGNLYMRKGKKEEA